MPCYQLEPTEITGTNSKCVKNSPAMWVTSKVNPKQGFMKFDSQATVMTDSTV